MKLANKVIESIKTDLEKSLDLVSKKFSVNKAALTKAKKDALGKDFDKPISDLTDKELVAIYGKKRGKEISSLLKKKSGLFKFKDNPKKPLKKKATDVELLLGASIGFVGAKTKEVKPNIFKVVGASGKFFFEADIDTKKKTIKFKGQTDDKIAIMSRAKKMGYKFL